MVVPFGPWRRLRRLEVAIGDWAKIEVEAHKSENSCGNFST